ncbi:hypothetical protein AC579_3808 [Pseudocercospora musae]|uniref:Uncharacterized protein n=1 Tax=Pseudocercospora musae TaxID=113226 RepID=A0A139I110_9PEZI|nr:hypothetical protein AC579_3808 [Pseudocercospora musae]
MLSASQKRLISYVGKTKPSQITKPGWVGKAETFCENFEKENPEVKSAEIKGSQPPKSRDDPSDKEDVISIRFFDANGKRIATGHLHQDGTGKVVRW